MRQGKHSVHSTVKDVVGEPRKEPISLPRYFGAGRPGVLPNDKVGCLLNCTLREMYKCVIYE